MDSIEIHGLNCQPSSGCNFRNAGANDIIKRSLELTKILYIAEELMHRSIPVERRL